MSSKRLGLIALVVTALLVVACTAPADTGQVATLQAELAAAQNAAGGGDADKVATLQAELAAAEEAAASAGGEEMPSVTLELKNPDTIVENVIGEPDTLDPAVAYDTGSSNVIRQVYEPLIFFKREKVDEFIPMLASEWEVSDDGLTYTFKIREGVKFHAGGDLEAHDVAYSYHRNLLTGWDDALGGPMWMELQAFTGATMIGAAGEGGLTDELGDDAAVCDAITKAVVADDAAGTVTMKLTAPAAYFPQVIAQTWGAVLDKEWMVEQGDWGGDCADWRTFYGKPTSETTLYGKMNGTGPYKLEEGAWKPGEELVLTANEDWWVSEPLWEDGPSGPPAIKTVTLKLVEEWSTRLAAVQAGDADIFDHEIAYADQVDPFVKEWIEGAEATADATTIHNPNGILRMYHGILSPQTDALFMNLDINVEGGNPMVGSGQMDGAGIPPDFFLDEHVRKAFNYCFNRDVFIQEVRQGEAIPARGPIIAGMPGYEEDSPIYDFSIEKCTEELKLARDGEVWEKGFSIELAYNAGNDSRRIALEILRDGLAAVDAAKPRDEQNITVKITQYPWPTYLAAQRERRLPAYLIGWAEDYHHPNNWVGPFVSCTGLYGGRQHIPEEVCGPWDELIAQGAAENDPAKAHEIYKELQGSVMDYALDVFILQVQSRRYMQTWVKGYYVNPLFANDFYYAALTKSAD